MECRGNAYQNSIGTLEETDHSENLGVDRRIILEWMLGK
jgi:hypothetical protein